MVYNFANALFFCAFLPETKELPLEEMNYLFTYAPWIVPGTHKAQYTADYEGDLERRVREFSEKNAMTANHEDVVQ